MTIRLCKPSLVLDWHTIHVGDDSLEIGVRRPNWGELTADMEASGGFLATRMRTLVADWRGVTDDAGDPLPFSSERFEQLCEVHPTVAHQAAAVVSRYYLGLADTAEKNSNSPPVTT